MDSQATRGRPAGAALRLVAIVALLAACAGTRDEQSTAGASLPDRNTSVIVFVRQVIDKDGKEERQLVSASWDGGKREPRLTRLYSETGPEVYLNSTTTDMAVDPRDGTVYWIQSFPPRILRFVPRDGTPSVFQDAVEYDAEGLTLDDAAGFLYWTSNGTGAAQPHTIWRAPLSAASAPERWLDAGETPNGLELDVAGRRLFWTLQLAASKPRRVVCSCDIGRTDPQRDAVCTGDDFQWRGLARDPVTRDLYATADGQSALFRGRPGEDMKRLAIPFTKSGKAVAFDVRRRRLFWLQVIDKPWGSGVLQAAAVDENGTIGAPVTLFEANCGRGFGVAQDPSPGAALEGQGAAPLGTVTAFTGPRAEIPYGWLECDGRALEDAHPLHRVLGATWGEDAAKKLFYLPDLRGLALRGAGANDVLKVPKTFDRLDPRDPAKPRGDGVGTLQKDSTRMPVAKTEKDGEHTHIRGGPVTEAKVRIAVDDRKPQTDKDPSGAPGDRGPVFDDRLSAHEHALPKGDEETRPANAAVIWIIRAAAGDTPSRP